MATSSMIPYSNPAGSNQTNPSIPVGGAGTSLAGAGIPRTNPTNPLATPQANPLIPSVSASAAPTTAAPISASPVTATSPGTAQLSAVPTSLQTGDTTGLYQQLQDIYGATGNSIYDFMQSISGVNSQTLNDYIKSLQPQFAQSGANLRASLGAGGVGANSSTAALGLANLGAQETGMIAGEQANLLQSQESLEAKMLMDIAPTAQQQVTDAAAAPWNMVSSILGDAGSIASLFMGMPGLGAAKGLSSAFGGASAATVPSSSPASEADF